MRTTFSILAIALVTACRPHGDSGTETDDTTETDTTETDDTNTVTSGTAIAVVNVLQLGELVPGLAVKLTGPKVFEGLTGSPITLDAPGTYKSDVGGKGNGFTNPVYASGEDFWAVALEDTFLDIDDGIDDPVPIEGEAFKVFKPGVYKCTYDGWLYSESAPEHKGTQLDNDHAMTDQRYEIDAQGKVHPQTDSTMGGKIGGGDKYMEAEADHLVLRSVNDPPTSDDVITDSTIAKASFEITVESVTYNTVFEVTCNFKSAN